MTPILASSLKEVQRGALDLFDCVHTIDADFYKMSIGLWRKSHNVKDMEKFGLLNAKAAWLECETQELGSLYLPVIDEMYFSHSNISPTQLVAAIQQGYFSTQKEYFNEIVLDITRDLLPSFGLPIPVGLNVHAGIPSISTIGLFSIFPKRLGYSIQGFAELEVIQKIWNFYRQYDKEWSSVYRRYSKKIKRDCVASLYSKPLSAADIKAIDIGAVIELQMVNSEYQPTLVACNAVADGIAIPLGLSFSQQHGVQVFCTSKVIIMNKKEAPDFPEYLGDAINESLVFEIGQVHMSVSQLAELRPGELVSLNSQTMPFVTVKLDGKKIARGELVMWKEQVAVQIVDLEDHGQ